MQSWEHGRSRPSSVTLDRVARALELSGRDRDRLLALGRPDTFRLVTPGEGGGPIRLASLLRAMRLARRLTQCELARLIDVRQSTVVRWENGEATPATGRLHTLLHALGASAEEVAAISLARMADPVREYDLETIYQARRDAPPNLALPVFYGIASDLWRGMTAGNDHSRWLLGRTFGLIAGVYLNLGRWAEVREAAKRSLDLFGTGASPTDLFMTHCPVVQAAATVSDLPTVRRALRPLLATGLDSNYAHCLLGLAELRNGLPDRAFARLDGLIGTSEDGETRDFTRNLKARALFVAGRFTEGREMVEDLGAEIGLETAFIAGVANAQSADAEPPEPVGFAEVYRRRAAVVRRHRDQGRKDPVGCAAFGG